MFEKANYYIARNKVSLLRQYNIVKGVWLK